MGELISERISAWIREHWELVILAAGVICLVGAVRDWDWLCDPAGTRSTQSPFGRNGRRLSQGTLGAAMIVIGLWMLIK